MGSGRDLLVLSPPSCLVSANTTKALTDRRLAIPEAFSFLPVTIADAWSRAGGHEQLGAGTPAWFPPRPGAVQSNATEFGSNFGSSSSCRVPASSLPTPDLLRDAHRFPVRTPLTDGPLLARDPVRQRTGPDNFDNPGRYSGRGGRLRMIIGTTTDGRKACFPLGPMSVADFHTSFSDLIRQLGGNPRFDGRPNEIPDPVPFRDDRRTRPTTPRP